MEWHRGYYGARLSRALPVTLDSIRVVDHDHYEEIQGHGRYVAKPLRGYAPFWQRIYHAWLVLTNRAGAFQFSRDHIRMANAKH